MPGPVAWLPDPHTKHFNSVWQSCLHVVQAYFGCMHASCQTTRAAQAYFALRLHAGRQCILGACFMHSMQAPTFPDSGWLGLAGLGRYTVSWRGLYCDFWDTSPSSRLRQSISRQSRSRLRLLAHLRQYSTTLQPLCRQHISAPLALTASGQASVPLLVGCSVWSGSKGAMQSVGAYGWHNI